MENNQSANEGALLTFNNKVSFIDKYLLEFNRKGFQIQNF